MKKIIVSLLSLLMLCSCSAVNSDGEKTRITVDTVKAVWITYYELETMTKSNETKKEFGATVKEAFKNLYEKGFNTVTVQVHPCADAFYKSEYFPTSAYCFGEQGAELKYDPLEIMVDTAHKIGLRIEAWMNPYRVSQSDDFSALSEDNIALKWKDSDNIIVYDGKIYFNPSSAEVIELIEKGAAEIVTQYDVDGLHFDDYFYPAKDKSIDESLYQTYQQNGGELKLADWRRENVSEMVKRVYTAVKTVDSTVQFGISPAADIDKNYSTLYADVEKWSTQDGYVDYIVPQIYFGFQNENQPFMKTAKKWVQTADCKLYIGLPLYKCGLTDEYAGERGINEFVENHNIIARQIEYINKLDKIGGFYIFSYSFLSEDSISEEVEGLYSAMQ